VLVDGVEETVPIGTTVRNLLERYSAAPPSTAAKVEGLRLDRALGPVVLDPAKPYAVDRSWGVRLRDGTLPVYGPGLDGLSLPLLHGDRLTISDR
jgi:hypothetical protein